MKLRFSYYFPFTFFFHFSKRSCCQVRWFSKIHRPTCHLSKFILDVALMTKTKNCYKQGRKMLIFIQSSLSMYIFAGLRLIRIVLALDTHLLYSYSHFIANQKPFTQHGQGVELTTTIKQIYTGLYTVVGRPHNQPPSGEEAPAHSQNLRLNSHIPSISTSFSLMLSSSFFHCNSSSL